MKREALLTLAYRIFLVIIKKVNIREEPICRVFNNIENVVNLLFFGHKNREVPNDSRIFGKRPEFVLHALFCEQFFHR